MAKSRGKVILVCASVLGAEALWFIGSRLAANECPVSLPSRYHFIAHFSGNSSAEVAQQLQAPSSHSLIGIGTARDWLFESKGTKEEAAWNLLMHLRKSGDWRQLKSRSHIIYSDDGKTPKVVMFNDYKSNQRHFVRVNGPWQNPGVYEQMLSRLPTGWLDRLKSSTSKERS